MRLYKKQLLHIILKQAIIKLMKLTTAHISDTHGRFDVKTGEGNILFHHGDATKRTFLSEMSALNQFFTDQLKNFDNVIYTPGNHDRLFYDNEAQGRSMIDTHGGRVKILISEGVEIFGTKIYCSPYSVRYGDYAFMLSQDKIHEEWAKIPMDTEILITHGPPYGILDYIPGDGHVGSSSLMWKTENLPNLKLHGFGHIHECNGAKEKEGILYINAATLGYDFNGPFNAWVVNWDKNKIINFERIE